MARVLARKVAMQPLCLPPATGKLPEQGGIVISSPAIPKRKNIEHAGHPYQQKLIRDYALNFSTSDIQFETTPQSKAVPSKRLNSSDAVKNLASKMAIGSDDLYELLELGHKRWHATSDEIKKSFRRISLIYHPDKISHQGEQARENSETHFKAVKKAYEILSDKKKRAAYDSIDDVDDSIPSEKDVSFSPERFYEKFGSCFCINARWAVSNRVPELGDDDADIDMVYMFYDFWYSFKSWRDFSFDLEYDTDQAECREEKRWMERQNSKHVKSRKLEENARIRRLVDLAYKHDPRLKRVKDAQKAKKDAQKAAKKRKSEEEARVTRERQENDQREAEHRAAEEKLRRVVVKKEKEVARQKLRKARQRLRAVSREAEITGSDHCLGAVESMCSKGNVPSIDAVSMIIESINKGDRVEEKALLVLQTAILTPHEPLSISVLAEKQHAPPINLPNGGDFSSEPAKQAENKEREQVDVRKSPETPKSWTQEELSLLSKAVAKYPGGTVDRWTRISEILGTRNAEEVLRKVSENRPSRIRTTASKPVDKMSSQPNAFDRFQEKKKGKPVVPQGAPSSSTPKAVSSSKMSQPPPNKLLFSPKQQSMFEAALKKHPAADGDARWKKVSVAVGKSPEQCKERFQELITFYRSRRAS